MQNKNACKMIRFLLVIALKFGPNSVLCTRINIKKRVVLNKIATMQIICMQCKIMQVIFIARII